MRYVTRISTHISYLNAFFKTKKKEIDFAILTREVCRYIWSDHRNIMQTGII